MEVVLADFVEDRDAAEIIAFFEKQTDERARAIGRSNRVAKRHPRAPLHTVHDECAAIVIEQDGFVAQEDQIGIGGGLRPDGDGRGGEIVIGRLVGLVGRMRQEPGECKQQQQDGGADGSAQEARRVGRQFELPPQLVRVIDVLVREPAKPDGGADRAGHRQHPSEGESCIEERGAPIECGPRPPQNDEDAGEYRRFHVIDALQQRRTDAEGHDHGRQYIGGVEAAGETL